LRTFKWRLIRDGAVEGRNAAGALSRDPPLQITQNMNQRTWEMTPESLQEWDDTLVHNKHVLRSLKKQPYHEARKPLSKGIQAVIGTLEQATSADIPTQIWARDGMLTSFQVWVIYRMAVHQLNLHYPGKEYPGVYQFEAEHDPEKETHAHIFWTCPRAKAWAGSPVTTAGLERYSVNVGARKAPAPTTATKKKLKQLFGRWDQDLENLHKQIWWALCSIIPAQLWMYRNKAVHHQERISEQQQTEHIWASGLRQLRAIVRRDRARSTTRLYGLSLQVCVESLAEEDHAPDPGSPPQQLEQNPRPESQLVHRLRVFKESMN
ncbi:hypothetical protein JG688_00007325, partial [Phytophthora aleatoria]